MVQVYVKSSNIQRIEEAKRIGINLSEAFMEIIDLKLSILKGDKVKMNLDQTEKRLKILSERIQPDLQEIQRLKEHKELLIKEQQEQELRRVEEEQKHIDFLSKCVNCGVQLSKNSKFHSFKKGKVCQGCWLNADSDSIRRWNDGSS
jgi:hypothetical protein